MGFVIKRNVGRRSYYYSGKQHGAPARNAWSRSPFLSKDYESKWSATRALKTIHDREVVRYIEDRRAAESTLTVEDYDGNQFASASVGCGA